VNEQKAETKEEKFKLIKTELYEPFAGFLLEYLRFSGEKCSLDDFCRQIIYQYARKLYLQIRGLATKQPLDLSEAWFHKWTDIAITIDEGEEDE
jgi:hypothetical protein